MKFVRMTGTAAVLLFVATMIPVYAQREEQQRKQEAKPQEHAQQAQQQVHAQQAQQQPRVQQQQQVHAQQAQQQPRVQQQQQEHAQQTQQQPRVQQQQVHNQQAQQQPALQQQRQVHAQQVQQQPRIQQQQVGAPQQRSRQQAQAWQQQKGWQQGGGSQGHGSWQQSRSQNWSSDHRDWSQRGGYGGYYIPQNSFVIYFGASHYFRLHSQPEMYMGYPRFAYGGYSFMILDPWPGDWDQNWYDADDLYIDYDYDGYYLYNRMYPQMRLAVTIVV